MEVHNILLTGDDGYNAPGVRLLVYFLKEKYNLTIAGTLKQQSGVGGKISIKEGGTWGISEVDGISAFWVDGTPVDAITCARTHFNKRYDLVISGINWGSNIGNTISSGTYSAAARCLAQGVADKAISISWDLPQGFWLKDHNNDDPINEFLDYPGKVVSKLIGKCIEENMWNVDILNINLPENISFNAKFTTPIEDITTYYNSNMILDKAKHSFRYPLTKLNEISFKEDSDVDALGKGLISITLCDINHLHSVAHEMLKGKEFNL